MDLWADAWVLARQVPWQPRIPPVAPPHAPPPHRPEVIVRRERNGKKPLRPKRPKHRRRPLARPKGVVRPCDQWRAAIENASGS